MGRERRREGGESKGIQKLPGAIDYASVTLRVGLTKSVELWQWMQNVVQLNYHYHHIHQ
jgi:phage tail-like protein